MDFKEQVNMILCKFYSMNLIPMIHANIFEDQFAILFNSPFVEYLVSILRHQHDVVGNLAIAMAKLHSSNVYHILAIGGWHHLWLKCQEYSQLKEVMSYRFKPEKPGEGSLHPQP